MCWPACFAYIWSMDTPARISALLVCFGGTSVRNRVAARACTPMFAPVRPAGGLLLRPLKTRRRSWYGASGASVGESSNAPSVAGVQFFITTPLGTYTTPSRLTGAAALCADANAGTMLSRSGSANVAPRPRSTVRRGIAIFVITIHTPQSGNRVIG